MNKNKSIIFYVVLVAILGGYFYFEQQVIMLRIVFVVIIAVFVWYVLNFIRNRLKFQNQKKHKNVIDLNEFRDKRDKAKTTIQPDVTESGWAVVFKSPDQTQMGLVQSLLESFQIKSIVNNRHSSSIFPSIAGLSMTLQVSKEDKEATLKIFRDNDIEVYKEKNSATD